MLFEKLPDCRFGRQGRRFPGRPEPAPGFPGLGLQRWRRQQQAPLAINQHRRRQKERRRSWRLERQGIVVLLPAPPHFGDAVGAPIPPLVQREGSFAFIHFQHQQIGGLTRADADIDLALVRPQFGELSGPELRRLTEVKFQRGAFRRFHSHQDPAQLLVMRRSRLPGDP